MRSLYVLAAFCLLACAPPNDDTAEGSGEAEPARRESPRVGGAQALADEREAPSAAREASPAPAARPATPSTPALAPPAAGGSPADDGSAADDASPCGATIRRATIARGVEAREPVGTHEPFEATGEPLYVFLEVNNPDAEMELRVRWFHDASDHRFGQTITAGVSPRWRTWVRHRVQPSQTGEWRVEVFTPGECLATRLRFRAE